MNYKYILIPTTIHSVLIIMERNTFTNTLVLLHPNLRIETIQCKCIVYDCVYVVMYRDAVHCICEKSWKQLRSSLSITVKDTIAHAIMCNPLPEYVIVLVSLIVMLREHCVPMIFHILHPYTTIHSVE